MISNEEFEAAKNNDEYAAIMWKAAQKFKFLGADELHSCKMIALWKTLQKETTVKFTTSLYNHVIWECLDRAKTVRHKELGHEKNITNFADDIQEIASVEYGNLLLDRYLYNWTLKELAERDGVSIQSIHNRIKKAKKILKSRESQVLGYNI